MTKQELRDMLTSSVSEYVSNGGQITKAKRAVWARGAKNVRTMKVANKQTTYSKAFTGPVGLKQTNLEQMGNFSGSYNGTKYILG
jgi:hypothetical protein